MSVYNKIPDKQPAKREILENDLDEWSIVFPIVLPEAVCIGMPERRFGGNIAIFEPSIAPVNNATYKIM